MTDYLTGVQIEKLQEIENLHFKESNRRSSERETLHEKWNGDEHESHHDKLCSLEMPFWNMSCCTMIVERHTIITDDGRCTMTWRAVFDPETIAMFISGCKWANEQGAEIPI